MNRVRVNSLYVYQPVGLDIFDPARSTGTLLEAGQVVRVINRHGCPKANTMGCCYVTPDLRGNFRDDRGRDLRDYQLVLCNSLQPYNR